MYGTRKVITYFAEFCLSVSNQTITVLMHNKYMSVLIFIQYDFAASLCCMFLSAVTRFLY
jgi:hypothetical protein